MKLSEAIRLGAMLRPQSVNQANTFIPSDGSCALQAATEAVGGHSGYRNALDTHWPWTLMRQSNIPCPACRATTHHNVEYTIGNCLNDNHRWTREQIAEWVATVEPQDVQAADTVPEAVAVLK